MNSKSLMPILHRIVNLLQPGQESQEPGVLIYNIKYVDRLPSLQPANLLVRTFAITERFQAWQRHEDRYNSKTEVSETPKCSEFRFYIDGTAVFVFPENKYLVCVYDQSKHSRIRDGVGREVDTDFETVLDSLKSYKTNQQTRRAKGQIIDTPFLERFSADDKNKDIRITLVLRDSYRTYEPNITMFFNIDPICIKQ